MTPDAPRSDAPRSDSIERLVAPGRHYRALCMRGPAVPGALLVAGIEVDWLAEHVRGLAVPFVEPLLERRRAAVGLGWPAVQEVYEADTFAKEMAAAAAAVWEENRAAYERIAGERIRQRRLRLRGARVARLSAADRRVLARRIARPADPLASAIRALTSADDPDHWSFARTQLEQAWATAWQTMAMEVIGMWADELAPRLARLEHLRRGVPGWALSAAIALAAALALLGAASLLL